jgi:hypothetical protein
MMSLVDESDRIWNELHKRGIIKSHYEKSQDDRDILYALVLKYFPTDLLQAISADKGYFFNRGYVEAAEAEIVERGLLGSEEIKL